MILSRLFSSQEIPAVLAESGADVLAAEEIAPRPPECPVDVPLVKCYGTVDPDTFWDNINLTFGPLFGIEPWVYVILGMLVLGALIVLSGKFILSLFGTKVTAEDGNLRVSNSWFARLLSAALGIFLLIALIQVLAYVWRTF